MPAERLAPSRCLRVRSALEAATRAARAHHELHRRCHRFLVPARPPSPPPLLFLLFLLRSSSFRVPPFSAPSSPAPCPVPCSSLFFLLLPPPPPSPFCCSFSLSLLCLFLSWSVLRCCFLLSSFISYIKKARPSWCPPASALFLARTDSRDRVWAIRTWRTGVPAFRSKKKSKLKSSYV